MFARRLAANLTLLLTVGFASAQQGPQLNTVFPPGAKAGETVEVTFTGAAILLKKKAAYENTSIELAANGSNRRPITDNRKQPR